MKKLLFIICCFSFFQGCGQKNEQNTINQNLHITASNIAEEIAKEVKHYPSEPIYIISYDMYYANFELYIDDMPAFKQFSYVRGSTADDINQVLFKKGKHRHTVKYKMYPAGKTEEGDVYNTFPDFTYLKLRLKSYDLQNKEDRRGKQYMEHRTPYTIVDITPYDKGERFIASGKDYYEGSFEIEVDVPFNITPPFANAQDLRKMDRKELENKLLKKYKEIGSVYQNKDYDNIARLLYDNLRFFSVSTYESRKEIQDTWNEMKSTLEKHKIELQPIKNYDLQFFANGKLVALVSKTSIKGLQNTNALYIKLSDQEKDKLFIELKHYFYIPEGETEFKVY